MKRLKVMHFLQDPAHCAVGASAAIANYYNPEIDYEYVKKEAYKVSKEIPELGLDSGQICLLLNRLGFYKLTLVSSSFNCFDYSWSKYRKKRLLGELENAIKNKKDVVERAETRSIYKWYKQKDFDNNIIISYEFGKYIRQHLNKGKPLILTFNWTMFFKFAKETIKEEEDVINGSYQEHAVVANGYDKHGVWIVDSHHKYYKYKRKKYRKGFYKISWENLMTIMGEGDLMLPE